MKYEKRCLWCIFHACLAVAVMSACIDNALAEGKTIPPMSEITATVANYFDEQTNYKPGDLINREQVEPLLDNLQEFGLPLPDKKEILADVMAKADYLVRQLSTPAGIKFMRQIARFPNAFDRVDRLSHLPRGQQTVEDLIRGPDGYKMIEYMTTAAGGKELGRMLSNSPNGRNFNKPTGRIYTVDILLERLEQSREESLKPTRKKSAN